MKRKYSKVYYRGKDKLFGFRYNFENNTLEWVSKWDMVWNKETKEYDDITLPDWKVTDAVGLSLDNWKDNPDYTLCSKSDPATAAQHLNYIDTLYTLCSKYFIHTNR